MLAREVPCKGKLRLNRSSRASVVANAIGRIVVTMMAATSGGVVLTTALATCALHGAPHESSKADIAKPTVMNGPSCRRDQPGEDGH